MATAAKVSRVSIDEYLRTDYRPDVEYLDGELREKPVVDFVHGETQGLIFAWFLQHYQEWKIRCAVETRTRVSTEHVRLPDVVVIAAENYQRRELDRPPLIAVEVLSPPDTYQGLKQRAADLSSMGVRNVWLLDEKARTAEVWEKGAWQLKHTTRLEAVDSSIYLDLQWLWEQLDQ